MRDYQKELEDRVSFLRDLLKKTRAKGFVFGNSGGKDSALVGILCKKACDNTIGIIMPCNSKRNYNEDKNDGDELAKKFNIEERILDLTPVFNAELEAFNRIAKTNNSVLINIPPRLRMTSLYAVAASENLLVAGTGNRSERFMGYFTKWGDGAFDVNPISDLTVTEVYEFLRYLDAPKNIINKAPSAGLYEGQTDEKDMGVTYDAIDRYIFGQQVTEQEKEVIERYHRNSEHKRHMSPVYKDI